MPSTMGIEPMIFGMQAQVSANLSQIGLSMRYFETCDI